MDFLCFTLSGSCGLRAITNVNTRITLSGGEGEQVRIANFGPDPVCVVSGVTTPTAAFPTDAATSNGAGVVILSGGTETFSLPAAHDTIAGITSTAGKAATIFVSRGKGA